MIILSNTTDILEVVLGGAITTNQARCTASWRDITSTTYAPDRTVILTSSATPVNAVAAPAASTQRVIDLLNVYNSDTVAATVTIQYNANGTRYTLWSGSLAALESVQYVDGIGWSRLTASGFPATGAVTAVNGTAAEITAVTAAGAVTLSLPTALTFTGKTVTGGTFNSGAFNGTVGATVANTGAFTTLSATGAITLASSFDQTISSASNVQFTQTNTNTGAAAGVSIFQYNSGIGAGGDAYIRQFSGTENWAFGIDTSDSSAWKVSRNSTLGTNDVLRVSSTGLAVTGALSATSAITCLGGATFLTTSSALTNGAGASAGTITNAPSVGNPTKWIGINDNGVTRYLPAW